MSSLAIPSAVTSTLPAVNIHPHGHGHKKASALDPTDDSTSSTAAQIPVGSAQNLFGSLFNSLQQIIGARPVPAAANPAALSGNAAATSSAAGSAAATGSKINLMA
ncbi:MAG: hypothetical protein ABI356_02915 [Steroidobacteraceae bacterium]